MSNPSETLISTQAPVSDAAAQPDTDRRADVDAKQSRIAALLQEVDCTNLLIVEPENFAWLTSGGMARGVIDQAALPALWLSGDQRWVISCNTDSQRVFDEELDGLGFQLKEWPWHWGREQLLKHLCHGKRVAIDSALSPTGYGTHGTDNTDDSTLVGDQLRHMRWHMSGYEQVCLRALGQILSHALEATCRTINAGETERDVAGQLSHRLLRRGAQPVSISVAADGRSRFYHQCGFTALPVLKYCVATVTARKYGLCATASRSMTFGTPEPTFRQEHDTACKVAATYLASTWPDAVPSQILSAGRRVYAITNFEHEWLNCPQGYITGRLPVELSILPGTHELFQAGWAVTWRAGAGAASSCDTFLITDDGPKVMTPTEVWPLKRIRIQGAEFVRPDLLQR